MRKDGADRSGTVKNMFSVYSIIIIISIQYFSPGSTTFYVESRAITTNTDRTTEVSPRIRNVEPSFRRAR